ncbi:thiamine pyrophosphate-requiring protein [Roseomonas sp. AR75]|uniref:thiamine pyrophosphate-requiring protein n=1 Tax=Roseomonas sp. AR75 TaxID=2562311 RepID=UPI0010BFE470|nr:thiamine pyrophosphate-requiring protein [Roseomonas sp. AR75]
MDQPGPSAGETLLRAMATRGVTCLFANSGTDFPSVIEAYARDPAGLPRPILCAHENLAVGMAHGHALVSGQPQAVMVHVNVGAANALGGLFNAAREFVPMLFMAGRTPVLESGAPGARSLNIHWAQEMFDQGGMLREAVKWDYELRRPEQAEPAVARALAIARSDPEGPVALMLPREVLAAPVPARAVAPDPPAAAPAAPDPDAVAAIAAALAEAERPLIITASAGRDTGVPAMLAGLAERFALRVVEYRPRFHSLDNAHPMHGGFEVDPWLTESDAILVMECDVPWIPAQRAPRAEARIFHAGPDPLFARYPMRGFGGEAAITVRAARFVPALAAALERAAPAHGSRIAARRAAMAQANAAQRERGLAAARDPGGEAMSMAFVTAHLAAALGGPGPDVVFVNEYPLIRTAMTLRHPGSFLGSSPVGSLGWGLPAALGAKLAAPDRLVVAALGDGSYLFANPVACHQASAAAGLPVLSVVFDNAGYGAVRRATTAMYPQGAAVASGDIPLSRFTAVPDYVRIVEACGGRGWRVEQPDALDAALAEAIATVRAGTQALVSVRCR